MVEEQDDSPSFGETIEDIGEGLEIVEYPLCEIINEPDQPLREKIEYFLNVYGERNPSIEEDKNFIRKNRLYSIEQTGRFAHIMGWDISHVMMSDFNVVYVGKGEGEEYYYSDFDGRERVRTYKKGGWEQLFKQLWLPFKPQTDIFLRQDRERCEREEDKDDDIPF